MEHPPSEEPDGETAGRLGVGAPAPLERYWRDYEAKLVIRNPRVERGDPAGADEDHPERVTRVDRHRPSRLEDLPGVRVAHRDDDALRVRALRRGVARDREALAETRPFARARIGKVHARRSARQAPCKRRSHDRERQTRHLVATKTSAYPRPFATPTTSASRASPRDSRLTAAAIATAPSAS